MCGVAKVWVSHVVSSHGLCGLLQCLLGCMGLFAG
jgi:hypothetical protein